MTCKKGTKPMSFLCLHCGVSIRATPSSRRMFCSRQCIYDYARRIEVSFWPRVPGLLPISQCWVWQGPLDMDGYGRLYLGEHKHMVKAHRVMWMVCYGSIPDDTPVVMHSCDNPPCVNPNHLMLGTDIDNRMDCVRKGRQWRIYAAS